MTPARLARGLYKTLKWLFLATLILILIAAGALYYLLGSDSGYRQLPDLIARFTPYTLEYDTLDGHLLGDSAGKTCTSMARDLTSAPPNCA